MIEALIGAALISLAALAVSQVVVQSANITNQAKTAAEFTNLVNQIRSNTSTEPSCRLAVGGPVLYNTPPAQTNAQTFNNFGAFFPNPSGGPPIAGQAIALYPPTPYVAGTTVPYIADPTVNAAYATWKDWQIVNLFFSKDQGTTGNPNVYPVLLNITAQKAGGYQRQTSTIRMTLATGNLGAGGPYILSCAPLTYGTDVLPVPTCNPGPDNNHFWGLVSDGTRFFCRSIGCNPLGATPTINPATPLDPYGNINCQ